MITTENIPSEYTPYQTLSFCSNEIIGGGYIFALGKILPLLIGVGTTPRVWLQAISEPGSKQFVPIVADSKSAHPAVSVNVESNKLIVSVQGTVVLSVEAATQQRAIVAEFDLRPLGLNVYGNSSTLNLGGMQMSHNKFSGVGVAFGLGA